MKVFPAVDILNGTCVQLVQGNRENAVTYGDPVSRAKDWLQEGADALHVINLDGAFGAAEKNVGLIKEIIRSTGAEIQLGGGIRSTRDAAGWLDAGVTRVIIGTLAADNPDAITEIADIYGKEAVMAGVDARGGNVVVHGWEKTAGDLITMARLFEEKGAGSLLFTNVDVEGLCNGIAEEPVRRLREAVRIPVIASGGITTPQDVRIMREIGVEGIVLGSALYRGTITLKEAIEEAER
ncbi:1-(5-phosphoribosyl)-5-[(5-phosphoribosylamino)methylideneamino]imidazole-4-carboxamide isomerase [Methanogenium organophilum]|uniref:1-(5-phosphoribosyl)-5-[(5-phosphoribosylamino)methylideneamino] imidazole-4-carboxamide isomerase n=1 Tax=Methanogenium organophilum TaxID=2199 RepID=A0A9X9T870_METOG|nr:1-(5-phosphoribosyl)-5-[(5-phosphoribosylamino)methylideneamino]imidazole-4-carboxamide isomerase [Methanogenium organophilum]WAI01854.1 1-(5-phosphoribosyl)-5-[(5-phosphoribosylamino)methylideneamino]imidazole-4-carboxamide isomerase [Methanogenium organophilum]